MSRAETTSGEYESVGEWADDREIDSWMLPLGTRKDDPMRLIERYADYIDGMPKYQATFTTTNVGKQFHSGYGEKMIELFLLRPVSTTNRKNRYVNPQYAHLGHHEPRVGPDDDRRAFYERYKRSPLADGEFFATHFGISTSYMWDWFARRGIDWNEQRMANRRRTGRTLYTIAEWDNNDHTQRDLARMYPANTNTVRTWIREHGLHADDWSVPTRPVDATWYRSFIGEPI